MRFIFLSLGYHPDLVGGAYRYVTEVASRLAARGHEVHVLHPAPPGRTEGVEIRRQVRLHRFPNGDGWFLQNWRQENRHVRRLLGSLASSSTLIVATHAFFSPSVTPLAGSAISLFTGPWAEEFLFSRGTLRGTWSQRLFQSLIAAGLRITERKLLRRVRRILTISQYYVRELPVWHGRGLAPIQWISAGVDPVAFAPAPDRDALRTKAGLRPGDFVFLSVRRLDPRMGLEVLVNAFHRATLKHPQARLWIAGAGPMRDALQLRIQELGLAGSVRLLGFVPEPDLPSLFSSADCTVLPSLALEGFGLATVESLACGTPVLGSRSGATPEILEPLDSRLLFDSNSGEALAAKLDEILSQPSVLPDGGKCRSYVMENFGWERPVREFERTHNALLGGAG